jgi:ADP-heptose:LPS heptosyltransferase
MELNSKRKRVFAYAINFFLFVITWPVNIMRRKRSRNNMHPNILICRPDRIGDVLMSTPIYHSLKQRFPQSRITLLCYHSAVSLLENNPYIDEIWPVRLPWWDKGGVKEYIDFFRSYRHLYRQIREKKFDVFIELRGDLRHSFLFGWLPNVPMRISNNRSGGKFLLTHCVPLNKQLHEIQKNYQLLSFFEPVEVFSKPEIYAASHTHLFQTYPIWERYVVLFNGGRSPLRRLSESKIAELVATLTKNFDVQCIMVGDKQDGFAYESLAKKINDHRTFLNLCGVISLPDVRTLIDKADLFIGIDSSINHIAASTHTPSVSLYGPMTPSQVQQLGYNKLCVFHAYPCAPCLQEKCVQTNTNTRAKCMEDISVDEIVSLARKFLSVNTVAV